MTEHMSAIKRAMLGFPKVEKELVVADYNAIEARGTAWLANAKDLLGVFARGEDPYLYQACHIYKVPQGTFTKKDATQRQLGKKTVLGCGYQMGGQTSRRSAASRRRRTFSVRRTRRTSSNPTAREFRRSPSCGRSSSAVRCRP